MADRPRTRFLLTRSIGLAAAGAILYALLNSDWVPWFPKALLALALPVATLVVLASLALHHIYSPALGAGCPYCGRMTLERRAISSFGERFHQCSKCGVRCRRAALGGWRDASDARFDARYQKKEKAGDPWSAAPGLEDEDLVASETHNSLIRSKRDRRPENPNGPGLG